MGKKEKEEIVVEPEKPVDKSIISSDEVEVAVEGDEEALLEQMERIKNLTKEQQIAAIEEMKRLAAEKAQKEAKAKKDAEIKAANDAKLALERQKALEAKKIEDQKKALLLEAQKAAEEKKKIAEQQALKEQQNKVAQSQATPSPEVKSDQPKEIVKDNSQKGGPSTFKRILAVILFLIFGAFIYFLPEVTKFINDYKASRAPKTIVTTGISTCTLAKSNEKLDINITAAFSIINSKLYKLTYTTVTKGDKKDDKEELNKLNEECLAIKKEAGELDGVIISCSLNNGINNNKQILDYEKLDAKEVTSAYTEAGGIYPEFQKNESIDKIEAKMIKAGYSCNRN